MATRSRSLRIALLLVIVAGPLATSVAAQNLDLRDLEFTGLPPCRIFDTRVAGAQTSGSPLPNPGPHCFQIRDVAGCGVPLTAKAVTLNATIVGPTTGGDLRLYPASANPGLFDPSTINYGAGVAALANGAILPLAIGGGCGGQQDMKVLIGMVGAGSLHLIVDVTGYFAPPGSGPLWGRGRPGTGRWGMSGLNSGLCSNGVHNFGLSTTAVEWSGAADACPQGTWVCTEAQRGTGACFTVRTDGPCDALACNEACIDWSANSHFGWLADTAVSTIDPAVILTRGRFIGEGGVTVSNEKVCLSLPVWCCALN